MRQYALRIISLVTLFVLVFTGCTREEEETPLAFIRINDVEITEAEYTLYLYETIISFETIGGQDIWETDFDGRSAVDVAVESAFNSMIAVKVITQEAARRNITMDDNQLAAVQADVAAQKQVYMDFGLAVSGELETAIENVIKDRTVYALARESIVRGDADDEKFEEYREAFYDETASGLQLITVRFIVCGDEETAEEVYNQLMAGGDFDALYETYSIVQEEESTRLTIYEKDVDMEFAHILGGQVGFVTYPIYWGDDTWRLLKVVDITESSEEEIEEKLRSDYDNIIQQQRFSEQLESLINSARIETNNAALDTFYTGFWQDYEKQRTE